MVEFHLSNHESEMQRKLSFVLLASICVGLFAPLGQQEYLHAQWMTLGLFGAAFVLLGALTFRDPSTNWWHDARFLNLLLLVAYLVHQFEEHGVDATGTHYAFMPGFNAQFGDLAGCGGQSECPLNPENIFYVNTILVWLFLIGVMIADSRRHVFASLCAAALLLVNALAHLQGSVIHHAYNPGLLTAIVLFVPLALHRYRVLLNEEGAGAWLLAASLVWGILAHLLLFVLAVLIYVRAALPQPLFPLALGIWALVPFFIVKRSPPAIVRSAQG